MATVDGAAFAPKYLYSLTVTPGSLLYMSVADGTAGSIAFNISGFTGTGVFALGSGTQRTIAVQRFASWGGTNALSSGTVEVTSYVVGTTPGTTRVAGTFTGTLQPTSVNSGAAPVTVSGSFEVRK